ncbi:MAG: Uma2 family endonuclease [Desulfobacterales bacterium]|nr:Uma2 family endonuclease [Desulfobacterales bacterium]
MHALKISKDEKYTYADYLNWPDSICCEIIDGKIFDMSPAPTDTHQLISWELSRQIGNFLINTQCQGRYAPFDVRFPEGIKDNKEIIDVVQPDIVVICDTDKIDEQGCHGAPEFIIEILSPSTSKKDRELKFKLYEKNCVKEYWMINPINKTVIINILEDNKKYRSINLKAQNQIEVGVLKSLKIDFDLIFKK